MRRRSGFISRRETFGRVGSTNDVIREWLDRGTPEVCMAVAAEQTAGRGRVGRAWLAPAGSGLLLSAGFRPGWLPPEQTWRLAAVMSVAMAATAERVAGLDAGAIRLKWPNDLVVEDGAAGVHDSAGVHESAGVRKVGGVLGETWGIGTSDPRMVVGLGLNSDWAMTAFPPELADSMTSLREISGGRRVRPSELLEPFVDELEPAIDALRAGRFDETAWSNRQATTGRVVRLERPDGIDEVLALGVDASTGALVIADPTDAGGVRQVLVGEVTRVRLAAPTPARV